MKEMGQKQEFTSRRKKQGEVRTKGWDLPLAVGLAALLLWSCGAAPDNSRTAKHSHSRDAKLDTFETLSADLAVERDPSDGAGRAWLVDPEPSNVSAVTVGSRHRFEIVYEAGELGIADGGAVYLQTSPFWGWDAPQVEMPEAPGYTVVATDAAGIELNAQTLGTQLLAIVVGGRPLESGERIRIILGAGPAKARVDRYAEHCSRIWIAVDGDGDGVRAIVPDSPCVDVVPAAPSRLVLTLPSTARPGETLNLTLALVDELGNAGFPFTGTLVFQVRPASIELPETIHFTKEHQGRRTIEAVVREEGVYRLEASVTAENDPRQIILAESNPLIVFEDIPRILWSDLHGHSQFSDGTGTPEDYFSYARDVSGLDVAALTDHDHWGMRFLDQHTEMWTELQETVGRFNEPGRFVALAGYEWTSWLHGHRHVLYFEDESPIFSSMDPKYETPEQLWKALENHTAISVAHHSAGGPVSTNWDFLPDAHIEPVTEVVSVHGSSEAPDSPRVIYDPVDGNFVRDAIGKGVPFGFVGSGDSHDGHPGLAQLASPNGGLAAIFSEEKTRDGVLDALRSRRAYATNGPRIWLRLNLDGHPMGAQLSPASTATQQLQYSVAGTAPIDRIDLVHSGHVVGSFPGEGQREASGTVDIPALESGGYVYIRVVQVDGGAAWSSPIYAR